MMDSTGDMRLQHRFRVKDGGLRCRDCDTVWGEGPADCPASARGGPGDPYAQRLHELTVEAEQVSATPDVGEPEVRRLAEIFAEALQLLDESGVTAEEERRAFARRIHPGRGQAIDMPPHRDLFDWIRAHYGPTGMVPPWRLNIVNPRHRPGGRGHDHWAG